MIKITIEASPEDEELIPLMLDHLCYSITNEMSIKLICDKWKGHSGGDDAYFGLQGKQVCVVTKS